MAIADVASLDYVDERTRRRSSQPLRMISVWPGGTEVELGKAPAITLSEDREGAVEVRITPYAHGEAELLPETTLVWVDANPEYVPERRFRRQGIDLFSFRVDDARLQVIPFNADDPVP